MSVAVLLGLAIVISGICHKKIGGFISASAIAALLSAIAFHVIGYFVEGYLDKFALISLVTTFMASFSIALGIGFLMKKAGTRAGKTEADRPQGGNPGTDHGFSGFAKPKTVVCPRLADSG